MRYLGVAVVLVRLRPWGNARWSIGRMRRFFVRFSADRYERALGALLGAIGLDMAAEASLQHYSCTSCRVL